jgi:predicted phosphodiesterase
MKILTYSDIHLEFDQNWRPPEDTQGDVMLLAGDMLTFNKYKPLKYFLTYWKRPVIYIAGNHEYYGTRMGAAEKVALEWIGQKLPQVRYLQNESIEIDGVHFFGGTMWTEFDGADFNAMAYAYRAMSDYRTIKTDDKHYLQPEDTVEFHKVYVRNLMEWFEKDLKGPRVVLSHHAPIPGPSGKNRYNDPALDAAYTSRDMIKIIDRYQPDLWVYGHTHQPNDQTFGKTRIISNPRGYPKGKGACECEEFDPYGKPVEL